MKALDILGLQEILEESTAADQHFSSTLVNIGEQAVFECTPGVTPTPGPSSIHALRPGDIDVVAAIGDSITAGCGIDAIFVLGSLTNYRGKSWSIGGDGDLDGSLGNERVITIPNIIRKFHSWRETLYGYSTGTGLKDSPNANLNRAVLGSEADALLEQTKEVIEKMRSDASIDMDNHWKLLTILIGGNDMCGYCANKEAYSPENYKAHLKDVLDELKSNVTKMMINLVPMFTITPLRSVSKGRVCDVMQNILCGCGVDPQFANVIDQLAADYYQAMSDLANSGDYDSQNFTVVLQPSLYGYSPLHNRTTGETDKTIFAPDCFHPNRLGHELLAYIYWNTMVRYPVGMKPLQYPIYSELERQEFKYACPDEDHPYIWTNWNSNNTGNLTFTTTTTTTVSTTTLEEVTEGPDHTDLWVTIGCIIGVVGIFVVIGLICLAKKEMADDTERFFG